jgi:integrase/recombinase XerD
MSFEQFVQERIYLQNVSPRTVEWYRQSFKWLSKYPLTEEGLKNFVIAMREAGLKPISCNSRIRVANAYLKWSGSPLRIAKVKEEKKLPATFRLELLKQISDFKPKRESERRLQALILTIMETGLRVSEAISLHIEKIDFDNLLIYLEGKGRKERAVAFSYELRKVLWRWRGTRQNGLLFATREGTKLGRRNVLRDFKRLCRRLG